MSDDVLARLAERVHSGELSPDRVELAAFLGFEPAVRALGRPADDDPATIEAPCPAVGRWKECLARMAVAAVSSLETLIGRIDGGPERLAALESALASASAPRIDSAVEEPCGQADARDLARVALARALDVTLLSSGQSTGTPEEKLLAAIFGSADDAEKDLVLPASRALEAVVYARAMIDARGTEAEELSRFVRRDLLPWLQEEEQEQEAEGEESDHLADEWVEADQESQPRHLAHEDLPDQGPTRPRKSREAPRRAARPARLRATRAAAKRVESRIHEDVLPWLLEDSDPLRARALERHAAFVTDLNRKAPHVTHAEIARALEPWTRAQLRPTWIPHIDDDGDEGPPRGSRFGGRPWLRVGEAWPRCARCSRALRLFLQLAATDLPAEFVPAPGGGLLQLFLCPELCPDSHLARCVEPREGREGEGAVGEGEETFAPARIFGWTESKELPATADHGRAGLDYTYTFEAETTVSVRCPSLNLSLPDLPTRAFDPEALCAHGGGEKLGGWPAWIQDADWPSCATCGQTTRFVFQLESNGRVPFMFGDRGRAYLFQCAEHADQVHFTWQCN